MTQTSAKTHKRRVVLLRVAISAVLAATMILVPTFGMAIPSPELVIGSVSSLSQIIAVALAAVSGFGALIAQRLGITTSTRWSAKLLSRRLIYALLLATTASLGLNIWQHRTHQTQELTRLQAALIRPAEFDGTLIRDTRLKETSFAKQENSPLAISTNAAHDLLGQSRVDPSVLFFDVRETGEHKMGTLPGARHVRFPDFLKSDLALDGKQVVLFCHNGNRSSETCAELAARGINCRFIAGGIEKWIIEGREFSDTEVRSLSDLRAIPDYPNKDVLLGTADFAKLVAKQDLQIVDTRYPGDFATGHLPGAINIPLRALPSTELERRIFELKNRPTITACYDRRSCFMSQVLGLEMSQAVIEYLGRYTTPTEYFIPPPPKPHVQEWLVTQQMSLWQSGVQALAAVLLQVADMSHLVLALLALSLTSRLLILPITLKSERDQIVTAQHADELSALKQRLENDPIRKARAIRQFYADKGLTPVRNLAALLFLPVMMLGLSATEQAAQQTNSAFLWTVNLAQPDTLLIWPLLFSLLAGTYLHWAVAKTRSQALLWWLIGTPTLFALVFQLSAAGNIYLCISLVLLLLQRAWVTSLIPQIVHRAQNAVQRWKVRHIYQGIIPLDYSHALTSTGNKSYRLSVLRNAGLPVPAGVVIPSGQIAAFHSKSARQRDEFAATVWRKTGNTRCAVRSSAASEDGSDQSFAGVFESVLNVGKPDMRAALETVIHSFSSARVGSYDASNTAAQDGNILVQNMVQAEFAGVLFTEDPSAPGKMIVELIKGCGDDLVSGRVTPQSLRFGRVTHTRLDEETSPINLAPLLVLGRQIEAFFGCPQDIEWVYSQGAFQIVQSRDVTTCASGEQADQDRRAEWRRVLAGFGPADPDEIVLEQDEMSEVLPRPTPLSFSLMTELWAPGGSLDLACRQLAVRNNLSENSTGHLVRFFGRTYADSAMKKKLALRLGNAKLRQLRRQTPAVIAQFRDKTIPALAKDLAIWRALDYSALPKDKIISCIKELRDIFVRGIYVDTEKINILASLSMTEAEAIAQQDQQARDHLLHPTLQFAPVNMIDAAASLESKRQKPTLMAQMGHRAIFDYELSTPRYSEAPDLLWRMLHSARPQPSNQAAAISRLQDGPVARAIALQDLKEQAKHEALRVVAELRRAVLALAKKTEFRDLIFHLDMDELVMLDDSNLSALRSRAKDRKDRAARLLEFTPRQASMTLRDCEILSGSTLGGSPISTSSLGGTCVSGSQCGRGRIFIIDEETNADDSAFDGFTDGDIIVCRMVNPAWLPYVQRAGAVLSEVGGWLSHMAIVAREKNILMLVKCTGLDLLQDGMIVKVGTDGSIEAQMMSGSRAQMA